MSTMFSYDYLAEEKEKSCMRQEYARINSSQQFEEKVHQSMKKTEDFYALRDFFKSEEIKKDPYAYMILPFEDRCNCEKHKNLRKHV